jgi:energy-converting hydrogenase Eha subunit C
MESKLATSSPTHVDVLLARPLRQVAVAAEVVFKRHSIAQDSPCKYLDVDDLSFTFDPIISIIFICNWLFVKQKPAFLVLMWFMCLVAVTSIR